MFKSSLDRKKDEIGRLGKEYNLYETGLKEDLNAMGWTSRWLDSLGKTVWEDPISGAEVRFEQAIRLHEFRKDNGAI